MNRTFLAIAGLFSASSLFFLDSALKGAAILVAAACVAVFLRRDSAATRHLAWLLAIVALLAAPLLSAVLPQWRVLPEWTAIPPATVAVATNATPVDAPAGGPVELPPIRRLLGPERVVTAPQPTATMPVAPPALVTANAAAASPDSGWNWLGALPLVWVIGCIVLFLRLAAARLLLWRTERRAMIVGTSRTRRRD